VSDCDAYAHTFSVMENLPPVILTDEDICLEIVQKGKTLFYCWSKQMQGLSNFLEFSFVIHRMLVDVTVRVL